MSGRNEGLVFAVLPLDGFPPSDAPLARWGPARPRSLTVMDLRWIWRDTENALSTGVSLERRPCTAPARRRDYVAAVPSSASGMVFSRASQETVKKVDGYDA